MKPLHSAAQHNLLVQIADLLAFETEAEAVRADDAEAVVGLARRHFSFLSQQLADVVVRA